MQQQLCSRKVTLPRYTYTCNQQLAAQGKATTEVLMISSCNACRTITYNSEVAHKSPES